jgi:hypothetical protein
MMDLWMAKFYEGSEDETTLGDSEGNWDGNILGDNDGFLDGNKLEDGLLDRMASD